MEVVVLLPLLLLLPFSASAQSGNEEQSGTELRWHTKTACHGGSSVGMFNFNFRVREK